jgi:GDP-L-fucose synthase
VDAFIARVRPGAVVVASVRSGGIAANMRHPADFLQENLAADTSVIAAAHRHRVPKLLYLGSSCMYPRACAQPMRVEDLMTGPLEPTSEAYATAKLAGLALVRAHRRQHGDDFIAAIPADAFGPGDDFSDEGAHVVAALIRRFHEAKDRQAPTATVWGTGRARRDFLFVDDLADACLLLLDRYTGDAPINVGGGADVPIAELAGLIRDVVGYAGALVFDAAKPDGMPRKTLDTAPLAALGFTPATGLRAGLAATYAWFLAHEPVRTAARS